MRALTIALLAVCACGPSWTGADARNAADATRQQLFIESICAEGQPCPAAQVRALERPAYCATASMLYRHGSDLPDAGIACPQP